MAKVPIKVTVNGVEQSVDIKPRLLLVHFLRENLRLTGTHIGCDTTSCGACTILIDGLPVNACLVPASHADGASLTTIEGLGGKHRLQRAFVALGGAQCGICTPGMIMAAVALARKPSLDAIRTGLAGNLCRCTGYQAIYRSIQQA